MKKSLTELVMILDRSGSMSGLESDTIGGFNSMIEKQRKEEGEAYVSVYLFDHRCELLYDRVDLARVKPMTDKEYYARGSTALLDAVGEAISHIEMIHQYARKEDVPEKTLFIIITDGMENSSRDYSYDDIRHMVKGKKRKGWEFLFLGANIDAIEVAGHFGIAPSRAVDYECDSLGSEKNFSTMSDVLSQAMDCESAEEFSAFLDDEKAMAPIREDYARRHKGKKRR